MITHICIARRFQAGESVKEIARYLDKYHGPWTWDGINDLPVDYVEHAIRQAMKREGRR